VPLWRGGCCWQRPGERSGSPCSRAVPQTQAVAQWGTVWAGQCWCPAFPGASGPSWAENRADLGSVSSICRLALCAQRQAVTRARRVPALTPCPRQPRALAPLSYLSLGPGPLPFPVHGCGLTTLQPLSAAQQQWKQKPLACPCSIHSFSCLNQATNRNGFALPSMLWRHLLPSGQSSFA